MFVEVNFVSCLVSKFKVHIVINLQAVQSECNMCEAISIDMNEIKFQIVSILFSLTRYSFLDAMRNPYLEN